MTKFSDFITKTQINNKISKRQVYYLNGFKCYKCNRCNRLSSSYRCSSKICGIKWNGFKLF